MAGSVAAPLLAGFTISLIGIVVGYSSHVRWPGLAMLLLSIAAVLLVGSVQMAFSARSWYLDPGELDVWWRQGPGRPHESTLKGIQADHFKVHRRYATGFQVSYNVGLAFLLVGLACCVAPPVTDVGDDRWWAAIVIGAAAVLEIGTILFFWARAGWDAWKESKPQSSGGHRKGVQLDPPRQTGPPP